MVRHTQYRPRHTRALALLLVLSVAPDILSSRFAWCRAAPDGRSLLRPLSEAFFGGSGARLKWLGFRAQNLFRICGDFAHLFSFFILFFKIYQTKQVGGISLKTQILYVIVFCTRYIDLLWNFASMYNWCMKLLFISASIGIVFVMLQGHKHGRLVVQYDPASDCQWPIYWLIIPCLLMGVLWHEYDAEHRIFEIMWSFSIWLEAVAILPQVAVMQNDGQCENINSHYVFSLGSYRAFYIINWIYRKFTDGYWHPIVVVGGVLQTALYCDFFYYYITAKSKGGLSEPVKVQVDAGVV